MTRTPAAVALFLMLAAAAFAEPGQGPEGLKEASAAFEALAKNLDGTEKLTVEKLREAAAAVTEACRSLPLEGYDFFERLNALFEKQDTAHMLPSQKKPVRESDVVARLYVEYTTILAQRLPAEKVKAHPAAATFPGSVPKDTPRVEKEIEIDTKVPRWHSTGLYAAPGEVIAVMIPEAAARAKLRVRIGAHKDRIKDEDSWKRCPVITRTYPLGAAETKAANAFGGPVYIEVPKKCTAGKVKVKISGAMEAPLYMHGKTDLEEWKKTIRSRPAPWAEVGSDKWIMTVPSEHVRNLDNPDKLMEKWNRVLDFCADLAQIPKERPSPLRLVCDVQIAAGFLHSGYPIMGHMVHAGKAVDLEGMVGWGFFHELGHNHSIGAVQFDGTGEVICNLFTVYCFEKLGAGKTGHKKLQPETRARAMKQYFENSPSFEKWKENPFLALTMYLQLKEAFGWEPYKKLFKEYRSMPARKRPKKDQDKRDQWLVRFSRIVGRNLGPFFEAWRVPTSPEARESVAGLPEWMPDELKLYLKKQGTGQ